MPETSGPGRAWLGVVSCVRRTGTALDPPPRILSRPRTDWPMAGEGRRREALVTRIRPAMQVESADARCARTTRNALAVLTTRSPHAQLARLARQCWPLPHRALRTRTCRRTVTCGVSPARETQCNRREDSAPFQTT